MLPQKHHEPRRGDRADPAVVPDRDASLAPKPAVMRIERLAQRGKTESTEITEETEPSSLALRFLRDFRLFRHPRAPLSPNREFPLVISPARECNQRVFIDWCLVIPGRGIHQL